MGQRVPEPISEGWGPRWAPLPGKGGSHSASAPSTHPGLWAAGPRCRLRWGPPLTPGALQPPGHSARPPKPPRSEGAQPGNIHTFICFSNHSSSSRFPTEVQSLETPPYPQTLIPQPRVAAPGDRAWPWCPPVLALPLCPHPNVHPLFQPVHYFIYSLPPGTVPPNTDQWCWMGGLRQPPAQHPQHPLTHPCEPGPIAAPRKTPPSSPPQALRHRLLPPEQTYTSPAGINHPLRNVGTCVREKKKVKSAWSCPALRAVEKRPPQPPSCWGSRWLRGRCHILCRILVPLGRPDAKASRVLMPSRQRGTPASRSPPRPPSWGRDAGAQSLNLRLACIFL